MAIKINDIPPEGLSVVFDQKLEVLDGGPPTAVTATLTIKPTGGKSFKVSGRVQASPELECSRCLNTFPFPVDAVMSISLSPEKELENAPEHELNREELDTEFYHGDEIEPLSFIKEQILLALPMVPLHHADCKGLCPVCGTNLNEADCGCRQDMSEKFGPFSELKDLLKKQ